jgi:16S rRNA (adenine1518-N6/adenine1519-N6)-dimethyltransferase
MLKPKKNLGQNFLRDENVLRKIAGSLHLQKKDIVLEIGAGHGALTKYLIPEAGAVLAVEFDERAIPALREQFNDTVSIIQDDILKVDIRSLARLHGSKLRIVGNIPYYLTSDILFYIFENRDVIFDATLMMQLEVAHRLVARPKTKEYGILSIFTQLNTECEQLFKVSRNVFFPRPKVDSAVVRLHMRATRPDFDEAAFRSVVRSTFGKRRKTLRNGLKFLDIGGSALKNIAFDLDRRPEDLSIEEFIRLTKELTEVCGADVFRSAPEPGSEDSCRY